MAMIRNANSKLVKPEKIFIARRLAEGYGYTDICNLVKEEFEKDISPQLVYDINKRQWVVEYIAALREEWKVGTEDIWLSHKRARLLELQEQYRRIRNGVKKEVLLKGKEEDTIEELTVFDPYAIVKFMERIHKEMEPIEGKGKPDENQAGIHSGGGDINIIQHYHGVSDDDLDRADRGIDEELRKHGYIKAPTNRGIDLTPSSN